MNEPTRIQRKIYPYQISINGNSRVLLWVDGGKEWDYFLKDSRNNLIVGDSISGMRTQCNFIENLEVRWNESGEIDLDRFWKKIRGLRINHGSSPETCSSILEGWNFLEDLAHTLSISKDLPIFTSEIVRGVYKKLFLGCNLPAMTPEGKEYQPIWPKEELTEFRSAIRQLWRCILTTVPYLTG